MVVRIKRIPYKHNSLEKFGFLRGRQIHYSISLAREFIHSHKKHQKVVVFKFDLSKAFDRVNWLYIILLMLHLGFHHSIASWIMGYISSYSFSLLMYGVASTFFNASQGLQEGCHLSPLLFLIIVESVKRPIK